MYNPLEAIPASIAVSEPRRWLERERLRSRRFFRLCRGACTASGVASGSNVQSGEIFGMMAVDRLEVIERGLTHP